MRRLRSKLALFVLAELLAGPLWATAAQDAGTGPDDYRPPELVTRFYEVGHLIMRPPDCGQFAYLMTVQDWLYGYGSGIFAPETEVSGVQRLKEIIERIVRPEAQWESAGGTSTLEFHERFGLLIVKTTPAGHRQIGELLAGLAERQTVTLVVTVQAVELDEKFAADLLLGGDLIARTDKQKKALLSGIKRQFARTSLTGANGQMLSTHSGAAQSYLADLTPLVDEATVGFDPVVSVMPTGLSGRFKVTLLPEKAKATLDYAFCYGRGRGTKTSEVTSVSGEVSSKTNIELPVFVADQRAGTVTVPLDCPTVLLGGAVPLDLLTGKDEDAKTSVQLDYVVTVRLIEGARNAKEKP